MTAQQIHTPGTFDEYRRRAAFVWRNGLDWAPEKPAHPYEPHWNAFKTSGDARQWFVFVDPRGGVNMRGV